MKKESEKIREISDYLMNGSGKGFNSEERMKKYLIDILLTYKFDGNTLHYIGWLIHELDRKIEYDKLKIELTFSGIMNDKDFPRFNSQIEKGLYKGKWSRGWYMQLKKETRNQLDYRYLHLFEKN